MSTRSSRKEAVTATKVIVRCLPPSLQREAFLEQVSPLPDHDYMHFAPADNSLGNFAYATVYLNFLRLDDVILFKEKFDGYVFLDNKGNEYTAIVEFAPFQKVPKKKSKRVDEKKGTIENDSDYKKFLETFQSESSKVPNVDMAAVLEEIENREKELKASVSQKGSTPLLEFLKKRREERLAVQKSKDDKRKKELERKQREEELRALRKRNESARLKQEKRNIEDRSVTGSGKNIKSGDTDYKPINAKIDKHRSTYSEQDMYYEDAQFDGKRSSDKSRIDKAESSDKKVPSQGLKTDADRSKNKQSSSKTDNTASSKTEKMVYSNKDEKSSRKTKEYMDYREAGDYYDEIESTRYKRKDGYDGNWDYGNDYRKYGSSQAERSYDASYYRRPKEWSSGRSDYYGPSKVSKHHVEKSRSGEPEKKTSRSEPRAAERTKIDDTAEVSKDTVRRSEKSTKHSKTNQAADISDDYGHEKHHSEIVHDSQDRLSSRKSYSNDQDENARQQKVRYKDRPERAIYNPKQRAAERRKQTVPSERGVDGSVDTTSEHTSADNAPTDLHEQ